MPILIKRYANRKLYNTATSRYITLKGIATLLEEGEEVTVIDNETGEDITQVALSQILVDNQRAKEDPSDTLLSQILSKGGDALYQAIRKSVDDATDGIGDFQDRFRRLVQQTESRTGSSRGFPWEARVHDRDDEDDEGYEDDRDEDEGEDYEEGDLDEIVGRAITQALESYDLPRRRDIEVLTRNLERVAVAVERLEAAARRGEPASTATTLERERDATTD